MAITTVRRRLRQLCKGRADEDVSINRRAFRHFVATIDAAEELRNAVIGIQDDESSRRRLAAALAELDDRLGVLEVPA